MGSLGEGNEPQRIVVRIAIIRQQGGEGEADRFTGKGRPAIVEG